MRAIGFVRVEKEAGIKGLSGIKNLSCGLPINSSAIAGVMVVGVEVYCGVKADRIFISAIYKLVI